MPKISDLPSGGFPATDDITVIVRDSGGGQLADYQVELGTMAGQNASDVDISGGNIADLENPLAVISGGTGADTASEAINNLLPSQAAHPGTVLRTNGTAAFWGDDASATIGIYNVVDYGATGNGTTDDTAAIQDAYAAIPATGGILYFPAGTYLMESLVIITSNTYVQGDGIGNTTLLLKGDAVANAGPCIQFADYNNVTVRATIVNCGISDLSINGNKALQKNGSAASDGINNCIQLEDIVGCRIENVEVYGADGYGVGVVGTALPHRSDLFVLNLITHTNNYDGMDIKGGFNRIIIDGIHTYDNGPGFISGRDSVGLDLRGDGVQVTNAFAENNNASNIRIRENCQNAVITNAYSITNTLASGFYCTGSNTGYFKFVNCYAASCGDNGFKVLRGYNTFIGCRAISNTSMGLGLQDGPTSASTTSTTSNTVDTGSKTFTFASVTGVCDNMIVKVYQTSSPSNYVQGAITSINGANNSVVINVTVTGGSGTISAWSVSVPIFGSATIIGGEYNSNTSDGINVDASTMKMTVSGATCAFNGRNGIDLETADIRIEGCTIKNNGQVSVTKNGILLLNMTAPYQIIGCRLTDDQSTKTQSYGINFSTGNTGPASIIGNDLTGNNTGATTGSVPATAKNWYNTGGLSDTAVDISTSQVTGVLLGANGGTGVANTGKTVTLGGNLTTSGAFAATLTLTNTTTVTLPTTGKLATLAGAEAFTNKTITSPTISGGTADNIVIGGGTPAAGTFTTLTAQTPSDLDNDTSAATTAFHWSNLVPTFRNPVINSDMSLARRGSSFTGISTTVVQTLNNWFANCSASGNLTVTQQSGVASNGFNYVLRTQRPNGDTSVTGQRAWQIIETADCYRFQGKTCVLSFYARSGADFSPASSQLSISVLTGTGTNEGSASLVASTWTGFTTVLNGVTQTITTTLTRYSIPISAFGASITEIGLKFFYATSGTAGAADYFDITGVQLDPGPLTPYEVIPYRMNFERTMPFHRSTFPIGTAPAQNAGLTGALSVKNPIALGDPSVYWELDPPMFKTPAIVTYNPSAGNANWRNVTAAGDSTVSVDPATSIGTSGVLIATSGTVANLGDVLCIHATAEAAL